MPHIKQLLIEQIKEYDQRAALSCAAIVAARISNQPENHDRARMVTCIASREALRHFGEVSGIISPREAAIMLPSITNFLP